MKRKNLRRILLVTGALCLLLVGCSKKNKSEDSESLVVGVNQFTEHPALDLVREGFEEAIEEMDEDISLDIMNAQGDLSNTISISEKFVKDKADLIFAIGTPSAQSTKQVTSKLPIIFSAVTDPVKAGLVKDFNRPGLNITGTSDESPIREQLSIFKEFDRVKTIGIIYNTGEINSQVQVEKAEEIAKELGLELETVGVSNINDIPQAVDSLLKKVDGIYTITDNMVASAINVVADKAREANIPTVAAEESHVRGGILITDGLSYFELGKQSAEMARRILIDSEDIESMACQKALKTEKVYNQKTLDSLDIKFSDSLLKGGRNIK